MNMMFSFIFEYDLFHVSIIHQYHININVVFMVNVIFVVFMTYVIFILVLFIKVNINVIFYFDVIFVF